MTQLSADLQDNYNRFVEGIKASGKVWSLKTSGGWVVCDSEEFEKTDVIPFWSEEAFAKVHCKDEWADYEPVVLDLEEFATAWLPDMATDGVLVGPNWNTDLAGLEIEPQELAKRIVGEA